MASSTPNNSTTRSGRFEKVADILDRLRAEGFPLVENVESPASVHLTAHGSGKLKVCASAPKGEGNPHLVAARSLLTEAQKAPKDPSSTNPPTNEQAPRKTNPLPLEPLLLDPEES